MTIQELNRLKAIVEKDLKLTDDNISQKLLDHPYIFHKYLDIYIIEKRELDSLGQIKKSIHSTKYNFFKFEANFRLDSAKEIEEYINGDKEYDDICLKFNQQELVVNYLVELLDMIKKLTYTMGNYIKMREFLSGK
jgi:hypothetical protein